MYEDSLRKVKGPAVGLLSIGALGMLGQIVGAILFAFGAETMREEMRDVLRQIPLDISNAEIERMADLAPQFRLIELVVGALGSLLLIAGGWNMLRLKGYGICFAACAVACLPLCTPCCGCIPLCLPGAAIGIWGLIVLFDDEVRDAFKGVVPLTASAPVVSAAPRPWAPPASVPPPAPPPPQDWNQPPPPPPPPPPAS